ncbi:protein unc-13 homolog C-like [Dermacentor albipictus]|uniref:protein unc-13 homolog C-like n=1 Tax=Dermacentor albipictus TaxID=60249 RepID=UPI0038FD1EC1
MNTIARNVLLTAADDYPVLASKFRLETAPVLPLGWSTTSLRTSPDVLYLRDRASYAPFSGRWRAASMQTRLKTCFFFIQVGTSYTLHSKRSSNCCLLLVPRPHVLVLLVADCFQVLKMLLLPGDVEQNPGPDKVDKGNAEVLAAINALASTMEARHAEVMFSLDVVKASQKLLEERVSDITTRLTTVEGKVSALEGTHNVDATEVHRIAANTVRSENAALQARLDKFEDRSRRENLIMYGLKDNPSESWVHTEEAVRAILADRVSLELPADAISRAHRLRSFVIGRNRPIVVKFASFKTRENVLAHRNKLRNTGVALQQDFCKTTRQIRKKLIDFAKATTQPSNLRYNRLYINKKCYVYCKETDNVCEIGSPNAFASGTHVTSSDPQHVAGFRPAHASDNASTSNVSHPHSAPT